MQEYPVDKEPFYDWIPVFTGMTQNTTICLVYFYFKFCISGTTVEEVADNIK